MSYIDKHFAAEELKSVFEEFKDTMISQRKELKKLGTETGETREKLNRLHSRLDSIETKYNRPNVLSGDSGIKLENAEYTKAFNKYIRKGDETEIKLVSMNETVDPEGGYFVPPEYSNFIIESLVQWSPIRRYARVISVNSKDFKIPVQQQAQNLRTGAAQAGLFRTGWSADMGPVNATDAGQIGMKMIPSCDLYALPYASQDMLDDAAFNIERYIQENLAKSMAFAEGSAFVNGNGIGQPMGLVTDALNFPTQVFPPLGSASQTIGESANFLIDAFYALPDYYSRNGTWLMNRQTLRLVREWIDGNGSYIWTPVYGQSFKGEAPATILSRPYAECIDMAAPNAVTNLYSVGSVPILFGDIYSAYIITDRVGIRVLRDPYSQKPFVLFYTTRRVGGQVVLPEAMVALNVAI